MHQDKLQFPWRNDEWLSQLVAEPIPEWLLQRSLLGALAALRHVKVITSPEQFCDLLLRGQHLIFDGHAYLQYFEDKASDIFWLALYALYDIGKTMELNDHFQAALNTYINPP